MADFAANVSAWTAKSKARITAVRNLAVERVVDYAQTPVATGGNMPVDTGFLRASLVATSNGTVPGQREKPDGEARHTYDGGGQLTLVLANAQMDDVITIAWTANYARHINYGARGRAGTRFRDLAAQRWPEAVKAADAQLGGSSNGKRR